MSSAESYQSVEEVLWGLDQAALLPVVRRAAEQPEIADFGVAVRHSVSGYRGYCAEKAIPTFTYQTPAGEAREVTVFAKRMAWSGRSESLRYEALGTLGLPLPRYYGCCVGARDEDIVFIEFMPTVGLNPACPDEAREFVRMIARINSAEAPGVLSLGKFGGEPQSARWRQTIAGVWRHGQAGDLGGEVREFCSSHPVEPLLSLAGAAAGQVAGMPLALNHNDPASQNVGWREGRREMVFFDLHKMSLSPRFSDFAAVARGLEAASSLARRELEDLYLSECTRWGGPRCGREELAAEVRWLERAVVFTILDWRLARGLDGKADWTDDVEEGRRQSNQWLIADLQQLWAGASAPGHSC